jgi:gliding motility-associated-like protein
MTSLRIFGTTLLASLMGSISLAHSHGHDEIAVQFHANKGQWPKQVLYRAVTPGGAVFVEPTALTYVVSSGGAHLAHGRAGYTPDPLRMHAYKVHFEGGVAASHQGTHRMEHYVNYFLGDDPSAWAGGVPVFAGVDLREVYPGIGMRIDGHTGLKYDWLVAPGASAAQIVMRYEGADKLTVNAGLLFVSTSAGQVVEQRPVAWQTVHGTRRPVECRYALKGDRVTFEFPYGYDKRYPLVIDPVVTFSSYIGSSANNFGFTATYDDEGHLYGGGIVFAAGYPVTTGVLDPTFNGGTIDMGISKFTPAGNALVWSTYIGGSANESPHSMVANSNNELYILGTTGSNNFPTTPGTFDNSFAGGNTPPFAGSYGFTYDTGTDIVVVHLTAAADALIGSTYIGGSGNDGLNQTTPVLRNYGDPFRGEIALDLQERPIVATSTMSNNAPTTAGATQTNNAGGQDGYIFRMNPELTDLEWATYYGGSGTDAAFGIQVSSTGDIYVTGGSTSNNLQMVGSGFSNAANGATDGYILRFDANSSQLIGSTYVGTSAFDQTYFVQLDVSNDVYVIGQTQGNYPVTPGKYANANASQFIHKFSTDLSTSLWSTRIAGTQNSNISPTAFLVSICGQIYFSGWGGSTNIVTSSTNGLPVTPDAFKATTDGSDFYLMVLNQEAVSLAYATFFGGTSAEHVDGGTSRFDKNGVVYQAVCAGCSGSFTTTPGAWSTVNGSSCNLGVFKIDFEQGVQVGISANVSDLTICLDDAVILDAVGSANTWTWDLGDGSPIVQGSQVIHQYAAGGEYTVMLVGVDSLSCNLADTAYATITVVPPQILEPAFEAVPVSDCQGFSIEFFNSSSGGDSYLWNFGDGATSTQTNPVHTYAAPGSYTITLSVIDALCQNSVDTVQVVVLEPPTLEIELDPLAALCEGASVTLDAGPGFDTYSWSTGATTPTITVSSVGTYSVTVTEGICTGSTSIEVVAQPLPPRAEDIITCPGQDALLSAPFAVNSIVWSTGDTTTTILADQAGEFWFVAVDTVGCTVRDTILVTLITVEQSAAVVPNVFSPNGDGKNDTFQVDGLFLEDFSMEILNRWGQTIYETNRADRGWNGGQNNTSDKAPEGTYFYVINFKDRCSSEPNTTRTGHVTLVR